MITDRPIDAVWLTHAGGTASIGGVGQGRIAVGVRRNMKKLAFLGFTMLLAGCGSPYVTHVYGRSGATFTAPSVCAALVQCMNSNETSCFYDKTLLTTATGTEETGGCKEVKK